VTDLGLRMACLLVLICLLLLFQPAYAVEANWTVVQGPFADLQEIVFDGNQYLAIGDGNILASSDGASWTLVYSHDKALNGITWNGSIFVAVGSGILTSTDGINWTECFSDNMYLYGVAWGDNQFVAVGESGKIFASKDGANWISQQSGCSDDLSHITFGQGKFVAVGPESILCSPDGDNWTKQDAPITLSRVRWLNGRFFAAGNGLLTSSDGGTWKQDSRFDSYLKDIAWNGAHYIAVGTAGSVYTSRDGVAWNKENAGIAEPLSSLTWGRDQLVAVGEGIVLTSPDGSAWKSCVSESVAPLFTVAWSDGQFMALGERAYSSPNGLEWALADWYWGNNRPIRGCARGQDRWVAVGWSDYDFNGYIYTFDGNTLLETGTTVPNLPFLEDVIWTDKSFVAIGYGDAVYLSSDGLNWREQKTPVLGRLLSIAQGNEQLIAVGEGGIIATSPDGITWSEVNSGATEHLTGVIWGDNQYVAVGEKGIILTSPDGVTWTKQDSGTDSFLCSVARGNELFVAVGSQGVILISADGKNWYTSSSGVKFKLHDITWSQNTFIVSGDFGSVLYAAEETLAKSLPERIPEEEPVNQDNPAETQVPWSKNSLLFFSCCVGALAILVIGILMAAHKNAKTNR
jgi:hypothetical protein